MSCLFVRLLADDPADNAGFGFCLARDALPGEVRYVAFENGGSLVGEEFADLVLKVEKGRQANRSGEVGEKGSLEGNDVDNGEEGESRTLLAGEGGAVFDGRRGVLGTVDGNEDTFEHFHLHAGCLEACEAVLFSM